MILHLSDVAAEPLHSQISRRIRAKILSGRLVAGDVLPPARRLAREAKVSVRSVRRAYGELETEGWVESGPVGDSGDGPRVARVAEERKRAVSCDLLADGIGRVVGDPAVDALGEKEIRRVLDEILGDGGRE